MKGQDKIDGFLSAWEKRFPPLLVLVGPENCGKRYIAEKICAKLKITLISAPDVSVSTVRAFIDEAYSVAEPVAYLFSGVDAMRPAAKNALLKVTEEPPQNAHFILTTTNEDWVLSTIKSRGFVFNFEPYAPEYIKSYIEALPESEKLKIKKFPTEYAGLLSSPGEIQNYLKIDFIAFFNFIDKFIDSVTTCRLPNALKVSTYMILKKTDEENAGKWALDSFFKALRMIALARLKSASETDYDRYFRLVVASARALKDLQITGVDRLAILDSFIFSVRREGQK